MHFFYSTNSKDLEIEVFGLKFKNRVGLAAGFDKDAKLYNELSSFGFGFLLNFLVLQPEFERMDAKKLLVVTAHLTRFLNSKRPYQAVASNWRQIMKTM